MGQAIARSTQPPRVWLQMSTATIYAHRFDAANDEYSGIIGGQEKNVPDTWRFSIDVAKAWEAAMQEKSTPGTRKVLLRAAMVMSPDADGVFDTLLALVRGGLGGRMGSGKQFMSWIHGEDFVRAIEWILERDELEGAVNLSSPNPLPNAAFMLELRRAWGIKSGKDFILVSHLAYKAFWPAKVPFSLMHIDTDHNFPETISYRDEWVEHPGAKLIVRTVQDSIARGRIVEEKGLNATHNARATDVSTTEPEKRSLIRHR